MVLKLLGMVMRLASSESLDLRYMREMARRAEGAVTCRLTVGPSFMLEHLD
jgi:hypothetical protein